MGSEFAFRDDILWMTNGAATGLEEGWLRVLATSEWATTPLGVEIATFLKHQLFECGLGMHGFDVDDGPFESAEARHLFAKLIERFAYEAVDAIEGRPCHASLDYLQNREPFWRAWWLYVHERIHSMVNASLGGELTALELPVDERTRKAIRVLQLRAKRTALNREHVSRDARAELPLIREQCQLITEVPEFFEDWPVSSLYALAELEEKLGLWREAAETTRKALAFERDPDVREQLEELARWRWNMMESTQK